MLTPLTTLYETTVSTVQAKIGSLLDSVHLDRVRNWFQPTSVVEGADPANAAVSPIVAETGSVTSWISTGFLVLRIFLYIFPILFAVLVANHLIFMPAPVRLFAFIFVYIYMGIYPVFTIGIPVYYLLFMAFNFYHNMQLSPKLNPVEKLALTKPLIPALRGFLPLSTWKTDSLWAFETLLFPFKYKSIRPANLYTKSPIPPTPAEVTYRNDRLEYEQYCAQLIPGFDKLITTGVGEALKQAYDIYMDKLNYSPVTVTPKPSTPPVPTTTRPKGTPSLPEGSVQSTSPQPDAGSPATSKPAGNASNPSGNASKPTGNSSKPSGKPISNNDQRSPYYATPLGPPPPLEQPK